MDFNEKQIHFTKMQGAGNDYVYVDAVTYPDSLPLNLPLLSRRISDRHFGVGGDGLVVIMPAENADFRMRMFNADGSEAEMCGNATRCIGKYVYEKGLTYKTELSLQTRAGLRRMRLHVTDGKVESVSVDMGEPVMQNSMIPVSGEQGSPITMVEMKALGQKYDVYAVGMGNPHGVVFSDCLSDELVNYTGRQLSLNEDWPEHANIEFVKIESPGEISMRVYERGSGETLACGTGACAAVVAGATRGLLGRRVRVKLRGGTLDVEWRDSDGHVYLTGCAVIVAEGVYFPLASIREGVF